MELLKTLKDDVYPAKTAAYTGTAGSTTTWPPSAQGVLIWSTTECYVAVGEGVTATTASTPIPAYTPIPFAVPQSTSGPWRVSAIQVSAGGTIYCKPVNIR